MDFQQTFSLRLLLQGVLALVWCVVVFLSLAGWGRLAARLLKIDRYMGGWAALGLVFACVVGGVANLAGLIYVPVLLAIIGVGLVLLLYRFRGSTAASGGSYDLLWGSAKPLQRVLFVAVALFVLLHLFTFIRPAFYNPWDDLRAYLLLPSKMLHVHHLAADPYSQRRVINSVGFNYFLQDLFLAVAPLKNLTLVDGGLGIMLLVASSLGLSRTLNLGRAKTLCFGLLAGLTVQIVNNLSFNWLPCGIYLTFVLIAAQEELQTRPILQAAILGAMTAIASGLKNNHVVCSALFILVYYGILAFRTGTPAFPEGASFVKRSAFFTRSIAVAGLTGLIVLLPWMVDLHHYSGTFFFPVLGHGYEYSSYHLLPSRNTTSGRIILKCVLAGVPILLLGVIEAFLVRWNRVTVALVAFSVASGISIVLTGLATGGDSIRRYTYPQTIAALLLLYPVVAVIYKQRPRLSLEWVAQGAVIAVILLSYVSSLWTVNGGFADKREAKAFFLGDLVASMLNTPLVTPEVAAEYQAVQRAVPAGSTVLQYTSYPFLFDDTRNTLYETSLPAMASPPPAPGWPILSDGEALGQWLVGHQVRYLIYSYGDGALEDVKALPKQVASHDGSTIMLATKMGISYAVAQIMQLSTTRRKVFDDGNIFVLDLETPVQP